MSLPKSSATRQRRNKNATHAQLETDEARSENPELGTHPVAGGEWHPRTLRFWAEVWDSPMAPEYLEADVDGLIQLATLIDKFWWKPSAGLAGEIRMQRQCFGLTPIDRRRLQWEIVRVEAATKKRPVTAPSAPAEDPRSMLRAV